jgi:carboxyl-terminal processing protease
VRAHSLEVFLKQVDLLVGNLRQDFGLNAVVVLAEIACAICETADEHSAYLTPGQFGLEQALGQTDLAGVGIELVRTETGLMVLSVVADGPGARAGIQPNDTLLRIDGQTTVNMSIEEGFARLFGPVGTSLPLEVRSSSVAAVRSLRLVRVADGAASVGDRRILDEEAGVGYIQISTLQKSTLREFDEAVADLSARGMRALVLDLRGNPGGHFRAAVDLADRFLSKGLIVSTMGRDQRFTSVYPAHAAADDLTLPVVVLVDQNTASAAEVVAGVLRDHIEKKELAGILIGERTYGKGTIQYLFPLREGEAGGLRMTAARFLGAHGTNYGDGIVPHLEVKPDEHDPMMHMSMMGGRMMLQRHHLELAVLEARRLLMR